MARLLDFFDGAQSETTPTIGNIIASGIIVYPDDATYEANEQGAPVEGNIYFNSTTEFLRYYNGSAWIDLVDDESIQTIINKTIDADNNTITNLEDDNIKVGAAINAEKIHNGSVDNTEFSYLDGVTSSIQTQLNNKQDISEKDQPNGYAGLDANGRISANAVPEGFLQYQGTWNASTNNPTLADGVGEQGDVYRTSVAGTQDLGSGSQTFEVGDWVTYNGSVWERSDFVGAGALNDLADVDTSGVADGQALIYNNGAGEWQPGTIQNVIQENIALVGKGQATWTASPAGSVTVQESLTDTNDFALTSNIRAGFTFTPSTTGELQTIVAIAVDRNLGNGDGTIDAYVYATAGGLPTGSALDSDTGWATSNLTAVPNTALTNNFNFSGNVQLQAGVTYAVVFESSDTGTLYLRRGNVNETFSENIIEDGANLDTYSLAPTQETIYHEVLFDNVSGSLVLDDDSFISVPPLADDRHQIDSQTIYMDNGECAYITLDRAAGSPTSRTVTVDDITNVTPDNNILIIARAVADECYFGLHDPQRLADGESVDVQKGGSLQPGRFLSKQIFETSGTWTKPSGVNTIIVEIVGGGGGGGGTTATGATTSADAACGGGGGYAKKTIDVSSIASETVTIGAGGSGGVAGPNQGSAGGTTSFGAHCSANGGGGAFGSGATAGTSGGGGATGGTATGGDINITGGTGSNGRIISGVNLGVGSGGTNPLSTSNSKPVSGPGVNGIGYGGGGVGATSFHTRPARPGGDGSDGVVIVWEYS
jgi:hypothetical protein